MNRRSFGWSVAVILLISVCAPWCFAQSRPVENSAASLLTVTLKPGPADKDGFVAYVDVTAKLQPADAAAGSSVLKMPLVVANVDTVATTMEDFTARDSKGTLALQTQDEAAKGPVRYRNWVAERAISGDLVFQYRAPIAQATPKRTGPPFALRTEGGGFSGAGVVFIATPASDKLYRLALRWDLSNLGAGSIGVSSFGDGDQDIAEPAETSRGLSSGFFMAGPVRRYPGKPTDAGFSSDWLDSSFLAFDPLPLMKWTAKLYDYDGQLFQAGGHPYRVFMRYNPVNPGGGVGLMNSFVVTYDRETKVDDLKFTLSHEMLHTFAPSLGDEQERLDTSWFSEGLAVFYQRLLPLRAGLITPDAFVRDLNETAARYYTNSLNNVPNDQIGKRFWEDTRVRVLPYDRGSMYMAVVDSSIRKASGGKQSLDNLVIALLERARKGLPNTPAAWVELVTAELGPSAKAQYESMLGGAVMLPESDAFGPCFKRTSAPLRRFELGFDPSIMGTTRVIRGLIPDSSAARAGLRNGDEIVNPVGLDGVQGDQARTLTLQIRREGKVFPVMYLPRGETVETYQWMRVPEIPDKDCSY